MRNLFAVMVFCAVALSLPVQADQGQLEEIRQIPGMEQVRSSQTVQIGEYHGSGVIDDIQTETIVINDIQYETAPGMQLIDIRGNRYSGTLKKGMYIYYFKDSDNRISKVAVDQ